MDKLTNELIAKVANKLNLEPALLKTVTVVECGNRDGFLPSGNPFHRCSGEQRAEHAAAIAILVEQASISANQSRRGKRHKRAPAKSQDFVGKGGAAE